jgi:hypothetical protein
MSNIKEKGGRPPLAESQKKDYVVKLCFDKGQYNLIDYKAKKAGISKAEFCREAALDTKITQVLTPEQLDIIRKLSGMANNLNQVAYQANIGHLPDLYSIANQTLTEILLLLHLLKK